MEDRFSRQALIKVICMWVVMLIIMAVITHFALADQNTVMVRNDGALDRLALSETTMYVKGDGSLNVVGKHGFDRILKPTSKSLPLIAQIKKLLRQQVEKEFYESMRTRSSGGWTESGHEGTHLRTKKRILL